MKKIIILLLVASMLSCTSCGDETSDGDSSIKDSSVSTSIAETTEESDNEESEETTTQERFYDFHGLNMYEPDDMILGYTNGYHIWYYDYETEEELSYAIVIRSMNYSNYNEPCGLDDVWEVLRSNCESCIDFIYNDVFKFYDAEVDTTEKVDFLGTEFIRSTGMIPFETYDDERVEINYAAYYGVLDFPAYRSYPECKGVPFMWISFSDSDSDEVKTKMEKIVDDVAEKASWISES